jgi:hypothetical protein
VPFYYTQPYVLLFAAGVLLAVMDTRFRLPRLNLPVSPAFLLLLPAPWLLSGHVGLRFVALCESVRYPLSVVIVAVCVLTANPRVDRLHRGLVLMGNAAYSTNVFHLWILLGIIPLTARAFNFLQIPITYPYLLIVLTVIAANILGLVVHLYLDLPISNSLRKQKGAS